MLEVLDSSINIELAKVNGVGLIQKSKVKKDFNSELKTVRILCKSMSKVTYNFNYQKRKVLKLIY